MRLCLQASVYDLYDMLSVCADEDDSSSGAAVSSGKGKGAGKPPQQQQDGGGSGGDGLLDTENLAVCARILESVGRGSDAQVTPELSWSWWRRREGAGRSVNWAAWGHSGVALAHCCVCGGGG